jgi:putative transposase
VRYPARTGFCHASRHLGRWWRGISFSKIALSGGGLIAVECVSCGSAAVTERPDLTAQGYRRFRCRDCGRQFNERSDGALNRASLPSDIIAFVVFCRLRYRLTLRDLSEIMLLRGFTVSHECIRQWEAKLLPVMGEALRKRRHGTGRSSGQSWYVDETYLKVQGRWCYLYRAIDRDGNLIDTMLSPARNMKAAQRFFRSARSVAGFVPDRVTTDGHNSYPRAIRSTLGRKVRHRTSVYLNNRLEQDHRGIKGRIRCMRGFKEHDAADRFCREHDELRNFLRSRSRHNQYVPAAHRRRRFLHHARIAIRIMQAA